MAARNAHMAEGNVAVAVPSGSYAHLRLVYDASQHKAAPAVSPVRTSHASPLFFLVSVCMVIAMLGASFVLDQFRASAITSTMDAVHTQDFTVTSGDTLWSIAEEHGVAGVSTQDVVAWLRTQNSLSSSALAIGQHLVVPATMG